MRILILRHGETEWNTCARLQGQQDIDLDENGIRLAHVTAANRYLLYQPSETGQKHR